MDIKKLQKEVSQYGLKRNLSLELKSDEEKAILIQTVKLNEEVGELCNDILSILQLQRASKLERFNKENIYQEFADVLITLLQLADVAKVDVDRALTDKLKKIKERYQ
jgi:NTP pyrophosphatase (non-canonical NTP hydrolase)